MIKNAIFGKVQEPILEIGSNRKAARGSLRSSATNAEHAYAIKCTKTSRRNMVRPYLNRGEEVFCNALELEVRFGIESADVAT